MTHGYLREFLSCFPPPFLISFTSRNSVCMHALSYINRKLVPILRQQSVLPDLWNSHGNKDGRCFCKHLHGHNRKPNIEAELYQTAFWKRDNDDVFSLWNTSLVKIENFVEKANVFYSTITIKFTAEMSEKEITFLDTKV